MSDKTRRIGALRAEMEQRGIDFYLVPTADYHQSEYVGDYFKCREYLSGFTGSAGVLLVGRQKALLWTDGRYFLQAEAEIGNSDIILMKTGTPDCPTVDEYLQKELKTGKCLGFDARVINSGWGARLRENANANGARVYADEDLTDIIWTKRPPLSCAPVYLLDEGEVGMERVEKLQWLRNEMTKVGAMVHLLTSLDDIAWLLNIRGADVLHCPVVLSYLAITREECILFMQEKALEPADAARLRADGISVRAYEEIYSYTKSIAASRSVLFDQDMVNDALLRSIPLACRKLIRHNPTTLKKAVKTPKEIANMRTAHQKGGRAMCRFLHWLKEQMKSGEVTEWEAACRVNSFREEEEDFLDLSFETIAAYGANGAMCHYAPKKEGSVVIEPEGFFLLDSGAQYRQGTTDVTRTVAVGALTKEEKEHYTLVLQGHIRLAMAQFPHGCTGLTLDCLARQPLWEQGLNFDHGTGHGIGYLLNVHEGPNNISWRLPVDRSRITVFEEGMITSNEPGLYLTGKYGIRTENLLVCKKSMENEFGSFYAFENLTLVPYEINAILPELLLKRELRWLNDYHQNVFDIVGPQLNDKEREWLREATAEITI